MFISGNDPLLVLTKNSRTAVELCEELERSRLSPWLLTTGTVDITRPRHEAVSEELEHAERYPLLEAYDDAWGQLNKFVREQNLYGRESLVLNIEDGGSVSLRHPSPGNPNAYAYGVVEMLWYYLTDAGLEPAVDTMPTHLPMSEQPLRIVSLTVPPRTPSFIDALADGLHYLRHNQELLSFIWAQENDVIHEPFTPRNVGV